MMTARHVVEANESPGYKVGPAKDIDIAFKADESCRGLPLGYVDRIVLNGVELVTLAPEDPKKLTIIPGDLGIYWSPTLLHPFNPLNPEEAASCFKPGISGSPIIYHDHIIGLVPWQNSSDPSEVAAVVFMGKAMREDMERIGLSFKEII